MKVELVYAADCPNVEDARRNLEEAMHRLGLEAHWREWHRDDPAAPDYARGQGSPTVLVDGRDVAESPGSSRQNACRLYRDEHGRLAGAPSVAQVELALCRAGRNRQGMTGES